MLQQVFVQAECKCCRPINSVKVQQGLCILLQLHLFRIQKYLDNLTLQSNTMASASISHLVQLMWVQYYETYWPPPPSRVQQTASQTHHQAQTAACRHTSEKPHLHVHRQYTILLIVQKWLANICITFIIWHTKTYTKTLNTQNIYDNQLHQPFSTLKFLLIRWLNM